MYKFSAGIAIMALIVAGSVAFASAAFAKNENTTTRPGWGYGDQNHIHTGPPGQSVVIPPFQYRNGQ